MFKSKMERHVRFCIQNFFNHDPKKTDDLEPKILKANLFQKRERGRGRTTRVKIVKQFPPWNQTEQLGLVIDLEQLSAFLKG